MTNPHKIFDGLLVMQGQNGNKKAISLLVKRWHKKLCKQAFWYTKDMDLAKDVAQDSWGVILKNLKSLKDPNSFGSWALTITTRVAIDGIRKSKKERDHLKTQYDTLGETTHGIGIDDTDDPIMSLRKAIKELPQNQQIILNLFYLEEFSIQKISDILDIVPGTVKSRLFTAREKLKIILKNRNYEE